MKEQIKKIAVLVSGGGTNLQALIDAQARGELGCDHECDASASQFTACFGINECLQIGAAARNEHGYFFDLFFHHSNTTPSSPLTISPMT